MEPTCIVYTTGNYIEKENFDILLASNPFNIYPSRNCITRYVYTVGGLLHSKDNTYYWYNIEMIIMSILKSQFDIDNLLVWAADGLGLHTKSICEGVICQAIINS